MSIEPDCEISTIIDVVPEHVAIGRGCFLADGIYLGGPLVRRGVFGHQAVHQRKVLQETLPYWQSDMTAKQGLGFTDMASWQAFSETARSKAHCNASASIRRAAVDAELHVVVGGIGAASVGPEACVASADRSAEINFLPRARLCVFHIRACALRHSGRHRSGQQSKNIRLHHGAPRHR